MSIRILTSLDFTKFPGCDEISGIVLNHSVTDLVNPITNHFKTSILPIDWKIHKIQPVLRMKIIQSYKTIDLHHFYVFCLKY